MGLSWQQGPLSPGAIGRSLVPEPLPKRLLYAEPSVRTKGCAITTTLARLVSQRGPIAKPMLRLAAFLIGFVRTRHSLRTARRSPTHLEQGQTVIPHGSDRDLDVPITHGKQT
jgi:hypothetical protein